MNWDNLYQDWKNTSQSYQSQQQQWKKDDRITYELLDLEIKYQTLIKNFSVAYLELTEWYIGKSLLDNPRFIYPSNKKSDFKDWLKSRYLVNILKQSSNI